MNALPFARRFGLLVLALAMLKPALAESPGLLPELDIDLTQTTVSGISSGAFMAVQFGVAHSAAVRGIAATAGGPYFCAGQDAWAGAGVGKAIARCMQGDPAYPARPISAADLEQMTAAARAWAARGLIDPVANLARQRLWLFHGSNDGVVKQPVNAALDQWFAGFTPASQRFIQDSFNAGHAQISAACAGSACQPCARTGGDFINACHSNAEDAPYDAAGGALQMFYGPLARTASEALGARPQAFDQRVHARRAGAAVAPLKISLADQGYVYVPKDCAAGQACRLHIAFHGCQQQAEAIGEAFVNKAGFNEWADANRIVVLYPQTVAAVAPPQTPLNPQGCWDWWGYNDFGWDMAGHYATAGGDQIASVWSMAERLASGRRAAPSVPSASAPELRVADRADNQIVLAWHIVPGASAYRLLRDGVAVAEIAAAQAPSWVDNGLQPDTAYTYRLLSVDAEGREAVLANALIVQTTTPPAACDPYFSLAQNRPVTRKNRPTRQICP